MKTFFKSKDFKTSIYFALVGLFASTFVAFYQMQNFDDQMKESLISQLGSVEAILPIAALQGMMLTFVTAFIGLKVSKKVNLTLHVAWNQKSILVSSFIGMFVALFITMSDRFIFLAYLPETIKAYKFSGLYFISGLFYGGFIEEVLLRLFVMSILVFLLWKAFARKSTSNSIPNWVYSLAIFLAAALFAAGHLPVTFQSIGNSVPIIIRCFLLNGIGGLAFGYLYWKKGLSTSILAHAMTHVFMQAVFMPLFF